MVSITLASTAVLQTEINRLEQSAGRMFLQKTRTAIRSSALYLIYMLICSLVIVLIKPFANGHVHWEAFLNGMALISVVSCLTILLDITSLVCVIRPLPADERRGLRDEVGQKGAD